MVALQIGWLELRGDLRLLADHAIAAGRCYGDSLQVGDEFTELSVAGADPVPVRLVVRAITRYGRPVASVGVMESCELTLGGDGIEQAGAGVLLRGVRDASPIS